MNWHMHPHTYIEVCTCGHVSYTHMLQHGKIGLHFSVLHTHIWSLLVFAVTAVGAVVALLVLGRPYDLLPSWIR